jgi:hypothetical protein
MTGSLLQCSYVFFGSRAGQLKWACKGESASALKGKFVPQPDLRAGSTATPLWNA